MNVFVCPNPVCADFGVERLFDMDALIASNDAEGIETGPVFCGTCDTDVSGESRKVADDYVPIPFIPTDEPVPPGEEVDHE